MRRTSALIVLAALLAPSAARAETFAPGSLIIPMDTDYQDAGMLRAYGLVYELLRNGVPVRWVIRQGKAHLGTDFTADAADVTTGAAVKAHGYRGGPFVVASGDAAAAMPIVTKWKQANAAVAVHKATAAFDGDVARKLVVAPTIAMHADGNQKIARSYMQAAGIPDSTLDPAWPDTSPDMLTPAEVAGPTTTNHRDGALFDANGAPTYCQFMSMHWNVSEAQASPETVAEVREFLKNPVHFFAECQAVSAFENSVNGKFLTKGGYTFGVKPSSYTFMNDDTPFAQIDGPFVSVSGSEPSFSLLPGDSYKATDTVMITEAGTPEGKDDVWMTGYLDGACDARAEVCGGIGKVSYLGGHQYTVSLPISKNPSTQGTRLFLNSLLEAPCATEGGQPLISVTKIAPASTAGDTVVFTLAFHNGGLGVALKASLKDVLPPGATFVSATGGGTFAGGAVTWPLGNLGANASGSVSVTVKLASFGTYNNKAQLSYLAGLTPLSTESNTTSTVFDKDTDGDGVVDSLDNCPNAPNPSQDLSTDVMSCGGCGVVCKVASGTPGCDGGACFIASCAPGSSDCDGLYANGCEYKDVGFSTDPKNCGGCQVACSFFNASPLCQSGTCAMGACDAGFADCNGLATDGCEYDAKAFGWDPKNCGGCGKACAAGQTCSGGACKSSSCPAGFSDCDGQAGNGCEYDNQGFASDANNCGGCALACSPAHAQGACVAGACAVGSCSAGFADCNGLAGDGCEYDTAGFASDPSNCGACGASCAASHATTLCAAGACAITSCAPGFSDCDGLAANGCEHDDASLASDPKNCGACGVVCSLPGAEALCEAGACKAGACKAGFVDADADPSNGCEYACSAVAADDKTCDGMDDDCDGKLDEDFSAAPCGVGACQSLSVCSGGKVTCTPGTPSAEGPSGSPSCFDGVDNDCSGKADADDPACACQQASECDDQDPCTDDSCSAGACAHVAIAGCGSGGASGSGGEAGSAGSAGSGASGASGASGMAGSSGSGASSGNGGSGGSGASGASGSSGAGAFSGSGGAGAASGGGGAGGSSGKAGQAGEGGSSGKAGMAGSSGKGGGGSPGQGGSSGAAGSGASGKAGASGAKAGAAGAGAQASGSSATPEEESDSGSSGACGCRAAGEQPRSAPLAALGLLGLLLARRRRR